MLRDDLNHVLCRKRRDAIRQRAPEFHRWPRRGPRVSISATMPEDHAAVIKLVLEANRLQRVELERRGLLCMEEL